MVAAGAFSQFSRWAFFTYAIEGQMKASSVGERVTPLNDIVF